MVYVAYELDCCSDCMSVIANADASGITDVDDWAARVLKTNATNNGELQVVPSCVSNCDEEDYRESTCGYCGVQGYLRWHYASLMTG